MPKMSFTDFLPAGAYRLRRAAVMTVGVLFMGFAVAALVQADLGTDPFTTACLAFAARMGWLLGSAELLVNAVMFCLVLWQDPHRIGLGTLANMVLVGYTADFFGWVFQFKDRMRIVEPSRVADEYIDRIKSAVNDNK